VQQRERKEKEKLSPCSVYLAKLAQSLSGSARGEGREVEIHPTAMP